MSTLQQPNTERVPTTFAVGYHQFHADASLNYQMNRFSTGTPDVIAEMRQVAPKIRDYADYTREFLGLADRALQQGEALKGAYYLRSAEFYMVPDDVRKPSARREFVRLMRACFGITDDVHHTVPYERAVLSSYRLTHPTAQGTIVLFGGFDSYIEELFPLQVYLRDAGLDVTAARPPPAAGASRATSSGRLSSWPRGPRTSLLASRCRSTAATWSPTDSAPRSPRPTAAPSRHSPPRLQHAVRIRRQP